MLMRLRILAFLAATSLFLVSVALRAENDPPCYPRKITSLSGNTPVFPKSIATLIQSRNWAHAIWEAEAHGQAALSYFVKKKVCDLMANPGKVKAVSALSGSSNKAQKITFESGVTVVFKEDDKMDPESGNEVAAYRLSELLGFHVVPMTTRLTIEMNGQSKVGSAQLFVENAEPGEEARSIPGIEELSTYKAMLILDRIDGNGDRQDKNYLFERNKKRVLAIDNGQLFLNPIKTITIPQIVSFYQAHSELKSTLLSLTDSVVKADLAGYTRSAVGSGIARILSKLREIKAAISK